MSTYSTLPLNSDEVISNIVAKAEAILSADTSLSIPRINFKYETWENLQKMIEAENKDPEKKNIKYPLVAMIRKSNQKHITVDNKYDSQVTFIIVNKANPNDSLVTRVAKNFVPVLRPIKEELFQQIRKSRDIYGYMSNGPSCTVDESYDFEPNTKGYQLPDFLDGIVVVADLKFNEPMVELYREGPTTQLVYVNDIKHIRITDIPATKRIQVELLSATYTDTYGVGYGASPVYQVYFDHSGSGLSISVGGSQTDSYATAHDGTYTGYVLCDDGQTRAILSFIYVISGGVLRRYTVDNYFLLNTISTNGANYPYYQLDMIYKVKHSTALITSGSISTDGGNVIDEVFFSPSVNDTNTQTKSFQLEKLTGYREITNSIGVEGTTLDSASYYKLV